MRSNGRLLRYFGGADYLGLGRHTEVLEAMRGALDAGAVHPGASRATTGEQILYRRVERAIARWVRRPGAVLLPCGSLAPRAAVQALGGQVTHLLLDERAHACVAEAAVLSRLPTIQFPGGDVGALRQCLETLPPAARPLVLCDGVMALQCRLSPLDGYLAALPRGGWLLVDDSHGLGVTGPGGRGTVAHFRLNDSRIVQVFSLSKAVGVAGGAVAGSSHLMARIRCGVPVFVGATAPPYTVVAGVLAALRILRTRPGRVATLASRARELHARLPPHPELACSREVPVVVATPASAHGVRALHRSLRKAGIYPTWICYPGGPAGGFLRMALNVGHSREDVDLLAAAIREGLER
ncbi:MAG: aminotransferase class I/II-fold pyridoxal phosphate-dependent enzyme [Verrucomicrobiae bacterium]|nr:aminotransferase class I/II-fold pyridoxal phosphate-dependent enzyme [Verrucomicrobiae bacterium]